MPERREFDAAYYGRFYGSQPVHTRRRIGVLATGVTALAEWWRIPIRSVLDVGAGKGYWRDWLSAQEPPIRYHGIDVSEYAVRTFGHEHADLATWTPPEQYDLVVCQSVLQYLDDAQVLAAVPVLAAACGGLLLVEVPTSGDRDTVIDPDGSDLDIHWRRGDWYRGLLDEHFTEIGAGLWVTRSRYVPFFELERAR